MYARDESHIALAELLLYELLPSTRHTDVARVALKPASLRVAGCPADERGVVNAKESLAPTELLSQLAALYRAVSGSQRVQRLLFRAACHAWAGTGDAREEGRVLYSERLHKLTLYTHKVAHRPGAVHAPS